MHSQKQEFSKEELKTFINEIKNSKTSEPSSLEHLIEGVLEAGVVQPPREEKRREEKPKRFRLPLFLSIALLGAFFCGSLFGFFWGKSYENTRLSKEIITQKEEISSLMEELNTFYLEQAEKVKHEIIEPIIEPKEPEKLAFSAMV